MKLHSNSMLLMVGQGDLEQTIHDKVKSLGLSDRVIFAGVRSDVNALMQAMDVFVFPSLFEGLGIVAVEAQAAGLPCVVSDRIPRECEKTQGLVTFLPLEAGVERWAEQILSVAQIERYDTSFQIKSNGFDIWENATELQEFYLNHWQK